MSRHAYDQLKIRYRDLTHLNNISSILDWDGATMMPTGAGNDRSEARSVLQLIIHNKSTDPVMADLLAQATPGENPWDVANLREMKLLHTKATALPAGLVEALAKAEFSCEQVWRQAKAENDFPKVATQLEAMCALQREKGQILGQALNLDMHDALIGEWDPGMTSAHITPVFDDLSLRLPEMIRSIRECQAAQPRTLPFTGTYSRAGQEGLCRSVLTAVGFDLDRGRIDTSAHPMMLGHRNDSRLTGHFSESNPVAAVLDFLHEGGHGIYTQGLPEAWQYQPVGRYRGMAIHESQSLFYEIQIGRSAAFTRWLAPHVAQAYNVSGPEFGAENIWRSWNEVKPSLIRIDADEVTYPLHIVMRYNLEKAMLEGKLSVRDLPEAFNSMMQDKLGITPPEDRQGCLQDIHWYAGLWGYFPSYTFGALAAAQFAQAARRDIAGFDDRIERGDFQPVRDWLREHVHSQGCLLPTAAIIEQATGMPPSSQPYLDYLQKKYLVS